MQGKTSLKNPVGEKLTWVNMERGIKRGEVVLKNKERKWNEAGINRKRNWYQ